MYGENKQGFRINRFGGLVKNIRPSKLNIEATLINDIRIKLGNTAIVPRGGLKPIKNGIDQTDSSQNGVYFTKNIFPNPTGDGTIVFAQKQPSGEIVEMYYWDNDWPGNWDSVSNLVFGWSDFNLISGNESGTKGAALAQFLLFRDYTVAFNAIIIFDWTNFTYEIVSYTTTTKPREFWYVLPLNPNNNKTVIVGLYPDARTQGALGDLVITTIDKIGYIRTSGEIENANGADLYAVNWISQALSGFGGYLDADTIAITIFDGTNAPDNSTEIAIIDISSTPTLNTRFNVDSDINTITRYNADTHLGPVGCYNSLIYAVCMNNYIWCWNTSGTLQFSYDWDGWVRTQLSLADQLTDFVVTEASQWDYEIVFSDSGVGAFIIAAEDVTNGVGYYHYLVTFDPDDGSPQTITKIPNKVKEAANNEYYAKYYQLTKAGNIFVVHDHFNTIWTYNTSGVLQNTWSIGDLTVNYSTISNANNAKEYITFWDGTYLQMVNIRGKTGERQWHRYDIDGSNDQHQEIKDSNDFNCYLFEGNPLLD